jgi:hypothetical protein
MVTRYGRSRGVENDNYPDECELEWHHADDEGATNYVCHRIQITRSLGKWVAALSCHRIIPIQANSVVSSPLSKRTYPLAGYSCLPRLH